MNEPDIILADEPTGNLDAKTSDGVMNDLINIIRDNQKSLIIVTHEQKIAEMMDRIFLLKDGVLTLIKENAKNK
jgi:putative ABC transport system ATP-binding protein